MRRFWVVRFQTLGLRQRLAVANCDDTHHAIQQQLIETWRGCMTWLVKGRMSTRSGYRMPNHKTRLERVWSSAEAQ